MLDYQQLIIVFKLSFSLSSPLSQVGEAHEKTKESSEYLKYLTQQAVALQRTMNEIYKNGSNASIMPLKARGLGRSYGFILVFIH